MTQPAEPSRPRRHWLALAARIARLTWRPAEPTAALVGRSYDRIAAGYDQAWTDHMRHLTRAMLDKLAPPPGAACVDLACGTGWATGELARRTRTRAIGVDASAGMLAVARGRRDRCRFVQADVLAYLRRRPARSADVITCCWALGYSRPGALVRQIARVLRPRGRVGIIDNTFFSLAGVLSSAMLAFAERPAALRHVMRVRFLPHSSVLTAMLRLAGVGVEAAWDGTQTYHEPDGASAIARLQATGAAAGFEFAVGEADQEAVFRRFGEILQQRFGAGDGVPITHRYLAAVGHKR